MHNKEADIADHAMLVGKICLMSNFSTQCLLDIGATDHIRICLSDFTSFDTVKALIAIKLFLMEERSKLLILGL